MQCCVSTRKNRKANGEEAEAESEKRKQALMTSSFTVGLAREVSGKRERRNGCGPAVSKEETSKVALAQDPKAVKGLLQGFLGQN